MVSSRPHLQVAHIDHITQGTIFNCVNFNGYDGCNVFGLIITARCDIAQNKFSVLNYLPVVKLQDWLVRDGLEILIANQKKEHVGQLKNFLKNANLSESLLISISLDEIGKVHFPKNNSAKKKSAKYYELADEVTFFNNLCDEGCRIKILNWFQTKKQKKISELIDKLSHHAVTGFYMFERLFEDEENNAYVCALRNVASLSQEISQKIANGLNEETYKEIQQDSSNCLTFKYDNLVMPVSCIASPTIEHLMQVFANLFTRIGLEDPNHDVIDNLIDKCIDLSEGD